MPTGPKPKPKELRDKHGTLRPDRTPEVVVFAPLSAVPPVPEGLGEAGREAWDSATQALSLAGALQRHFLPLIEEYAGAVDMAHQAREELREAKLVQRGTTARPGGINPHFRAWRDSVSTARSLGEQIGATPVGMARLGLAQVKGLSLSEELAARRAERPA